MIINDMTMSDLYFNHKPTPCSFTSTSLTSNLERDGACILAAPATRVCVWTLTSSPPSCPCHPCRPLQTPD